MRRIAIAWGILNLAIAAAYGEPARLPHASPQSVSMSGDHLRLIDQVVAEGLSERLIPGCVVLVGFILLQWAGGSALGKKLHETESRLILEQNARAEAEHQTKKLQGDIEGLKASIDSIRKDAEQNEKDLEAKSAEIGVLSAGLLDAQEKVKAWEEALKARDEALAARDEKIKELAAD